MTTPTGQISAWDVNIELGRAGGAQLDLNDSAVRALAGIPSGTISMNDLRGKSAFSATVSPSNVSGSNSRLGAGNVTATTNSATATPVGGTGPFTYLWEYVSGDSSGVNSTTSATTAFTRTAFVGIGASDTYTGYYRCKVTDSTSKVAYTSAVEVSTTHSETS